MSLGGDTKRVINGKVVMESRNLTKCPACGGDQLISDDSGTYCASCRHILDAHTDIHFYTQKSNRIGVRWSDHKGYIRLTNPVTGEVAEIPAKGLDKKERWLFDRLNDDSNKNRDAPVTETVDIVLESDGDDQFKRRQTIITRRK